MSHERAQVQLNALNIDFRTQTVTLESDDGRVGRYSFAPAREALPEEAAQLSEVSEPQTERPANAETREKDTTVTLSGKLMTQPQDGKPDSRGKPTAYARFAAHDDGEDAAHLFIATFHNQSRAVALRLQKGSALTLKGYPHSSGEAGRLDTLSVMSVVAYPGRLENAARRPRTPQ